MAWQMYLSLAFTEEPLRSLERQDSRFFRTECPRFLSFVLTVFFAAFGEHRFLKVAILALYSSRDLLLAANDRKINRPVNNEQIKPLNTVDERNAKSCYT